MPEIIFAIPGDLTAPSGGYGYDRHMLALLPKTGITIRHLALPGSFPHPSDSDLRHAADLLAATPDDAVLLIDGLALGAMPAPMLTAIRRHLVALVHHPLCLEDGLKPDRAAALRQSETEALALAQAVITTSHVTARILATQFGVQSARITVAEPGTEPAARSTGTDGSTMRLLTVGSVVPRKAHDVLITALASISDRNWRLDIVGSTTFNPAHAAFLCECITRSGLADHIKLHGAVSPTVLETLYHAANLFVLPSRYEGYGMVLGEALVRGLPIVCTSGCAAAETVPRSALCIVPPGDAAALCDALRALMNNAVLRRAMADAAWNAGQSLPRWTDTASRIAQTLRRVRG